MPDIIYTLPTGGRAWMTLNEIATRLVALEAKVGQLAAGTPVTPPSDPNWLANQTISSGSTIVLLAGTQTGSVATSVPCTVKGAGMRMTIIDGQGGVGSGHRLSMGKGIIHAGAAILLQDIGFINGGGGDGTSDGEAGVYCEAYETRGSCIIMRCAFDGCEDGIFMPSIGAANVDLVVDRCVFGRLHGNGLADGRSHDMYVAGATVAIARSIFAGTSRGNTVKCRGPRLDIGASYIARTNGRWIDTPGGCVVTSTSNTYVTLPGAPSGNAMGFYDETDTTANPGNMGSFISTDDTFVFSRMAETIWINSTATVVTFTRPVVRWVGAKGSTPPIVTIQGPGAITGNNPFTPAAFTEASRLDAVPQMPADPVA